jgi:hypothetical protein
LISGNIENVDTKDQIPFAHVYTTIHMIGSISNTIGDYSLNIPVSSKLDTIVFSHVGFATQKIVVNFTNDTTINISLTPVPIELTETIITGLSIHALFDSVVTHISENYPSKPISLDAYLRIRGLFKSEPSSFKTGATLGEFALKIYKTPYSGINNKSSKADDQIKFIEWQKSDTLFLGMDNILFYIYPSFLPRSDVLNNIEESFVYNKKWMKNNSIFIDGIIPYQHGNAYRVIFQQKEKAKGKPYEGIFLIDSKSYAIISYERYLKPTGMDFSDFKKGLFNPHFGTYTESSYWKYNYEKIGSKWYLSSINLSTKETKLYENKGLDVVYFSGSNEDLDKATVMEFHDVTFVVTRLTRKNVHKFKKEELLRVRDIKPFVLTDNNIEFREKYNTISNSDLFIDRVVKKRIEEIEVKEDESKKN